MGWRYKVPAFLGIEKVSRNVISVGFQSQNTCKTDKECLCKMSAKCNSAVINYVVILNNRSQIGQNIKTLKDVWTFAWHVLFKHSSLNVPNKEDY